MILKIVCIYKTSKRPGNLRPFSSPDTFMKHPWRRLAHLLPWPPCIRGTCRPLFPGCRPQSSRQRSRTARWPGSLLGRPWLSPVPFVPCKTAVPCAPPTSISVMEENGNQTNDFSFCFNADTCCLFDFRLFEEARTMIEVLRSNDTVSVTKTRRVISKRKPQKI